MAQRRVIRVKWYNSVKKWGYRDTDAGEEVRYALKHWAVDTARLVCQRIWARKILCQLVVHGKNGRIQFESTYGRDPKRRRG